MSCEYPVLCPECGGNGYSVLLLISFDGGQLMGDCPTCLGDGEVCPAKRDAYRAEHGYVQCVSCDKFFDPSVPGSAHDPTADVYSCPDCQVEY